MEHSRVGHKSLHEKVAQIPMLIRAPARYQIAIERGGQKLYQRCRPEFSEQLFDLTTDPREQNDIIPGRPALAHDLATQLQALTIIEPCALIINSSRGKAPKDLLSPEQIEELRSLGYVQ